MSFLSYLLPKQILLCFGILASSVNYAGVVINGTRVIYPGNEKEVTVKLTNAGNRPVLVQNWIDSGNTNSKPESENPPFIITPPINRIDPSKSQTLRLSYIGLSILPQDRESIYWLNVLEVPSINEDTAPNRLQVVLRSRIKLFYRPANLVKLNQATEAAKSLKWAINDKVLTVENNSPYYVSLTSILVQQADGKTRIEGDMIAPKTSQIFQLDKKFSKASNIIVSYEYVNDWGALKSSVYEIN